MLEPGRRTLATTYVPGRMMSGTFGPTSTTRPKFSCPMTRKSSPGGAAPYSAALISLSVPSTPTRRTCTRTPRPSGISSMLGRATSSRWMEPGLPGCTAMAFMPLRLGGAGSRYSRRVEQLVPTEEMRLVEGLRAGDEDAFVELMRLYGPSMLRIAQLYVRSRAVAEEVVQDAWLAVLKGIARFEGRSSLKTWLFRILTNTAKTRAVREARSVPFSPLAGDEDGPSVDPDRFMGPDERFPGHWSAPPQSWGASPEERLVADETLEVIRAEIGKLPPTQALVITMRDVEGFGSEEVCNALEISETNQRVLLHRARTKVRRALGSYLEEAGS